ALRVCGRGARQRGGERGCMRERKCVCDRERERESVCVCRGGERECVCERESANSFGSESAVSLFCRVNALCRPAHSFVLLSKCVYMCAIILCVYVCVCVGRYVCSLKHIFLCCIYYSSNNGRNAQCVCVYVCVYTEMCVCVCVCVCV